MAALRARRRASMIYEIEVDGRPARLLLNGIRFRYQCGDIDTGDRDFSIDTAGAGRFSVLVGGQSYEATVLSGGEISVNGRTFRAEVIDPREWRSKGSAGGGEGR